MPAVLLPNGRQQFFTTPGVPAVGYKLMTWAAGTSTPQATWADAAKVSANTNPIILDARGEAVIFWDGAYKVQLQDSAGAPIWTVDNVQSAPAPSASLIPSVDNSFTLGSPAFSWANVYVGANHAPVLDTTTGNIGYYARTQAEITAGVTPTNFSYAVGNILRYGADPAGVANSFAAFASAVAVCKITGNVITVPAGNFKIDTTSGTLTCSYVTFMGTGVTDGSATPAAAGSVLSIVGTANSPFTIGPGVTFDGIAFFYPAQVDTAIPIVFPPTIVTSFAIAGAINFVYIQNCTVFNAYRFFVDTDTTGSIGHVFFIDNTIYGILTCFELAYNAEIITFTGNEFTFGHYLAATEGGLRGYTRANGSCLKIIRTDGITFQGNVCFGYLNGIIFPTSATLCQLTSILGNYFDNVLFPIIATGTGNLSNFIISGNIFIALNGLNTALIGNNIKITTSGALALEAISITGNVFSTCTGDAILISGVAPRSINVNSNQIDSAGAFQAAGSFACLNISGTSTSYVASNNYFTNQAGTPAVVNGILGTAVDAVITGNLFGGYQTAINAVFNLVMASGNISYGTLAAAANNYGASATIVDVANAWDKDGQKVIGFGTPTGQSVVASFPGATATLLQTSQTVAEILIILKAKGIIGA